MSSETDSDFSEAFGRVTVEEYPECWDRNDGIINNIPNNKNTPNTLEITYNNSFQNPPTNDGDKDNEEGGGRKRIIIYKRICAKLGVHLSHCNYDAVNCDILMHLYDN